MGYRLAVLLVRLASRLVPRDERGRFLREWEAELWHEHRRMEDGGGREEALKGALGSFADALTIKRMRHGRMTMKTWIGGVANDLRHAARGLLKTPGFSAVAVLTLALGIGGSVAIFTLLNRVVLDPLPYPESERLVRLTNRVPGVAPDEEWQLATAQYVHYGEHAASLEKLGTFRRFGVNLETGSGARRVMGARVSATLLELLGAQVHTGRLILPADDEPESAMVAVLSHEIWSRDFGADPEVLGRTISVNSFPVEVVGVMERGVALPVEGGLAGVDLWLPVQIDPAGPFGNNHVYPTVARLAPGYDEESARDELTRIRDRLPEVFPDVYHPAFFERYGFTPEVVSLKSDVVGEAAENLWILLGAVGLVLLIACANVANLFLVRAEERHRELAIRTALGAGRAGLARYLLAESLSVSLVGGTLALLVGFWGTSVLVSMAPETLPRLAELRLDGATLAFAAGLSLVVGVALAAIPFFRQGRGAVSRFLAGGGRSASANRGAQRIRSGMVVGQVALALTLTVGAGLLVQTVDRLQNVDPGFEPRGAITVDLFADYNRFESPAEEWGFYRQVLERIRAIPGVSAAGMASDLPLSGGWGCTVQAFRDRSVYDRLENAGMTTCAGQTPTVPGYFEALGLPVVRGRALTPADLDAPERGAVVVSRAFAERFWPGEDPLGKGVAPSGRSQGPFYEVVGVAGDVPAASLDGEKAVAIYYPVTPIPESRFRFYPSGMQVVVRAGISDPLSLFPQIRRAVGEIDPLVPVANARSLESMVEDSMSRVTFTTLLLQVAALAALLLAAVGLYGVVSYVVSRRTREIGMRIALGARPGRVQRMIVGSSVKLTALGLVVGTALALASTRVMKGLLFEVEPTHPLAYAVGAGVLAAVGVLAAWLPARRAARVDPSEALRAE